MSAVSVVVPCHNEEEVLPLTVEKLISVRQGLLDAGTINEASKIVFVDDGSTDETWNYIESLSAEYECVSGIKLSRNVGHQNALIAGLSLAEGDAIISIDADLQDDVNVMTEMIEKFKSGTDVVYAVRTTRPTDTFFKRFTAELFYKFMIKMGVDIVYNHADYRLLSRRAVDSLKNYEEVNLFIRGIIPLIGFASSTVYFDRAERAAGESKYPFFKMLAFAIDGITSFSVVPLRIIALVGIAFSILAMGLGGWAFYIKLFTDSSIPGWASVMIPLSAIGGIQLFSLGVVGEYVGKIYEEVKARPRFFVEKQLGGPMPEKPLSQHGATTYLGERTIASPK